MKGLLAVLLLCATGLEAKAADAPFLWQIGGPKATHYLAGSVHLLPESAYPLPAPFDAAYARTAALVLETDPAELAAPETQSKMLAAGLSPDGLHSEIAAPLYARVQAQAQALQLPGTLCDRFRAWFCALNLGVLEFERAGMQAQLGLDRHFYLRAVRDERSIGWLESPSEQLALFSGLGPTLSEQFLASTLDDLARSELRPEALVQLWRDNDVAALEQFISDTRRRFPEFHARLLSRRNLAWIAPLSERLDGPVAQLIVVGAAHLVGPEGLIALLRARGYRIEPVALTEAAAPPGGPPPDN